MEPCTRRKPKPRRRNTTESIRPGRQTGARRPHHRRGSLALSIGIVGWQVASFCVARRAWAACWSVRIEGVYPSRRDQPHQLVNPYPPGGGVTASPYVVCMASTRRSARARWKELRHSLISSNRQGGRPMSRAAITLAETCPPHLSPPARAPSTRSARPTQPALARPQAPCPRPTYCPRAKA